MSVFQGLLEGFTGARDKAYLQSVSEEQARRKQEGEFYKYLLQSNDRDMQTMALTALFENARPTSKAKGLRGFMGEVQSSSMFPQIQAYMDQLIPNPETEREMAAIAPPPRPGSAALPAQAMVDPEVVEAQGGRSDLPQPDLMAPPTMQGTPGAVEQAPMAPPGSSRFAGATMAGMAPPPESRFKRRGTGVPTAEEIAEATAVSQMRGRITALMEGMRQARTPEERRLVSGIGGAPEATQRVQNVPSVLAVLPDGTKVPAGRAPDGTLVGPDGEPLPDGTTFERTTSGSTGSMTFTAEDNPENRARYGVDPSLPPSETRTLRVQRRGDGSVMAEPAVSFGPPDFGGTTIIQGPEGTGQVIQTPRNVGGPTNVVGEARPPVGVLPPAVAAARALVEEVDKIIAAAEAPTAPGVPRRPVSPQQRDQITVQAARRARLPLTTYFEARNAAQLQTPANDTAGSAVDRVFQRLLNEQQGATAPPAPVRPPMRGRGAGPVPARP
jgi:hypothetical protein